MIEPRESAPLEPAVPIEAGFSLRYSERQKYDRAASVQADERRTVIERELAADVVELLERLARIRTAANA